MKKVLEGWLRICFDDTMLYKTEKDLHWGNPHKEPRLREVIEEFGDKKIRITIEEID